jgi:outer membrane protein insertion porin family
MRINSLILIVLTFLLSCFQLKAQVKLGSRGGNTLPEEEINYETPKTYEIGGIEIKGVRFLAPEALIAYSGLKVGDKIEVPGLAISAAIKKLWEQGILGDIQVQVAKVEKRAGGEYIFLDFVLKEKPRLSKFMIKGLKKGDANDIREKIGLIRGKAINDAMMKATSNIIRKHFLEKGFFDTEVAITQQEDTSLANSVALQISVTKGKKLKINSITFVGNTTIDEKTLRKKLKETKRKNFWRFYKASRFVRTKFETDKQKLIDYYLRNGYRDITLQSDSVWKNPDGSLNLTINLEEGQKYVFGNINWTGNFVYKSEYLATILGIQKGDIYNMDLLQKKLNYNPSGLDISSLYMDDGYLFFSVDPNEVGVNKDSIDIELRMNEGPQARINRITIQGNTKTNDHVILREIRTLPGEKFSRSDLIRTQQQLATLGYFDPEKIGINPVPNPQDGTVDIHYSVEEKPSDQIELSGGWGGFFGFIGTLGLSFNNFSMRKIGKLREWAPLPSGDGQRFSIRFQANGRQFQTYSMSFTEPWFGGKRPNSFTVGFNRSVQRGLSSSNQVLNRLAINGFNISLGKRLRWPDDYFSLITTLNVQRYDLFNYTLITGSTFGKEPTHSNSIALNTTLSRNSLNNPTFPTTGSTLSLIVNFTPPYSAFRKSNVFATDNERFRWVEFHKWNFDASWFTPLAKNLVINTRAHFGFIGNYNKQLGIGPFERFRLGGSGLSGFNFLLGYDIIALRGYGDGVVVTPNGLEAGVLFNKFVTEIRYAISTNPAATIYVHSFLEGGNSWGSYQDYNPFNIYRSGGVGVRIFMPAFGMLGVDFGRAFDGPKTNNFRQAFQFTIGQQIR